MTGPSAFFRIAALVAIGVLPHIVQADSWDPPETFVKTSNSGVYRVTIVPPISHAESTEAGAREKAYARIERRLGERFALAWEQGLVNKVVPTNALIANDGAYLVTFENWGRVGMGPDVVVIYRRGGELVRMLSLAQILPAEYVRHLPRGSSSIWWGGKHRLLERDTVLELRAAQPNPHTHSADDVPVARVRLADGSLQPPEGPEWERAMAKVQELEAKRQARWEEKRRERAAPLRAPDSSDRWEWQQFQMELSTRLLGNATGSHGDLLYLEDPRRPEGAAESVARVVRSWDNSRYAPTSYIFLSPTSDRLAIALAAALGARSPGSLAGKHVVFVGTAAEARAVAEAVRPTGARLTVVDKSQPFSGGEPLAEKPPDDWPDFRDR